MTKYEAAENLRYLISDACTDTQFDYIDEIEMAISALENQTLKKARTEAINEFADRLKTKKFKYSPFGELVYVKDIDNQVKEMVVEE